MRRRRPSVGDAALIVIDSSAVVAIALEEPGHHRLLEVLERTPAVFMSAGAYVETAAVLASRVPAHADRALLELDALLERLRVEIAPLDAAQARAAAAARIRFGKGFGGPLNFGDTFPYALAKAHDAALLYIGDDFSRTDVVSAL